VVAYWSCSWWLKEQEVTTFFSLIPRPEVGRDEKRREQEVETRIA